MDCPGLYDTSKTQEQIATVIVQAVACTHPGPHAILYIIRLGRYTQEEFGVYNRLKALFDDTITRYMILLFTGGDELEDDGGTLADLIREAPADLTKVIEECGNRCIVFNNKSKKPKPQVDRLLDIVRKMKESNAEEFYTCPKYSMIGEGLEAEIEKRLADVRGRELEREKYIQELEVKAKEAERALAKANTELEEKNREREKEMKTQSEIFAQENERLRQELKAKEHEMDTEKKEREENRLQEIVEQMKRDLDDRWQKMKESKEKEEERVEKLRQEQEALDRKRREEERRALERQRCAYEEEMNRMKGAIAKGEDSGGFLKKAARGVASIVTKPFKLFRSLFS